MIKIALPVIFTTLLISGVHAQQAAKSVYFELGGPGLASFNFDTRFTGKEDGIGGRIGVGGFSVDNSSMLAVPVGLNYLVGKNSRHYFEVGAGFTYINFSNDDNDDEDGTFEKSFGHLTFGYRLQPANGGFLFRAAIVPIFTTRGFIPYYAGVAFGYKF